MRRPLSARGAEGSEGPVGVCVWGWGVPSVTLTREKWGVWGRDTSESVLF